jgi:hypothetical protein
MQKLQKQTAATTNVIWNYTIDVCIPACYTGFPYLFKREAGNAKICIRQIRKIHTDGNLVGAIALRMCVKLTEGAAQKMLYNNI